MIHRAIAVAVLAFLAGCGKLTTFDVDLSSSGVIGGSLSHLAGRAGGFSGWSQAGGQVSRTIENQGVTAADIESARITAGSISVSVPREGFLDFVESFEIWVEAPGLERTRIAHQSEAFSERRSTYGLVLEDVDLKPYITAPSMTLHPELRVHHEPDMDHEIDVSLVLRVKLELF